MGSCFSAESRSPLPGSPLSPHLANMKKRNSRKRLGSRGSSFEYRKDEALHRIPGRFFLNGSTDVASLFTQQGKKGTNQDAMIVWENFGSRTDTVFCGIFDGHGPYGHLVAKRESRPSIDFLESEKHPDIFETLKESFLKAFKAMDRELRVHPSIDSFCSGTTAVTLVKQGPYLVIGNLGDSRAVLGTRDKNNMLTAVQLTVDLKPNLPAEAERIRRCKGRVFALHDEPEVTRVWLPNNDSPGLAMARAFGDFCLKDFGLISVPEITFRHLTENDEFVVLATDGIWDVLSNEEAVEIIASAPARSSAARALVEVAIRAWRYKYPTSKVDDCAVVCLFLDSNSNHLSTASNGNTEVQPTSKDQLDNDIEENNNLDVLTPLNQSGITRTEEETSLEGNEDPSMLENMNSDMGINWSALEGVSRVNTLVNLPRFIPEKEEKAGK
ncbi:hypothetical protein V6Z12_D08G273200 [Gossypium hirsutum]|uniref:PPM-type phosphatase domain-containing protein n=1 Tax=Gossypium tomentosum TaxID=34277 RepID=A0A5D2K2U2_GOSTO|nr:hypothetical protein ES332_D08G283000v1 [Gossypium tomentosum]